MLYNPPTGGAANDPYVGKNVAAGQQGSKIPPGAVEYPQREILNAITAAGLTPTNGDLTQLAQAIAKTARNQQIPGAGRLLATPRVLTTSQNYVPLPGMLYIVVDGVGGGGGGGGTANPGAGAVSLGAPGTAGTYAEGFFTAAQVNAALVNGSIPVTIGAGGQGGVQGTGTNGGTTIFGSLMSIPGGVAGGPLNAQVPSTVNATGTTSAIAIGAWFSRGGSAPSPTVGLSTTTAWTGAGGDSPFGTGGYTKSINNNGAPASGYGGGGGGTATGPGSGSTGGSGSPGLLRIFEYGIVQS